MQVVGLWRYPVKSLQGERLDTVDVTPDGLAGDREFGIVERATGFVLTARREPRLLLAAAALVGDGVQITLPDGSVATDDSALSAWLGRPVSGKVTSQLAFRCAPVESDTTFGSSPQRRS